MNAVMPTVHHSLTSCSLAKFKNVVMGSLTDLLQVIRHLVEPDHEAKRQKDMRSHLRVQRCSLLLLVEPLGMAQSARFLPHTTIWTEQPPVYLTKHSLSVPSPSTNYIHIWSCESNHVIFSHLYGFGG